MADLDPSSVIPVADVRAGLSGILRGFRKHPDASPVAFGSHRRAEAVIVPYARYQQLASVQATEAGHSVLEDIRRRSTLVRRIAELNKVRGVSVFGSVSRGEETPASDIDLLVEPEDGATLFDLAQLGIDLEQLFGRSVDVVSAQSLRRGEDDQILAEAIRL